MGVKAALCGKGCRSYYSDRQQKVYSAYAKKITGACLINHKTQVQQTMELGLALCHSIHHELELKAIQAQKR